MLEADIHTLKSELARTREANSTAFLQMKESLTATLQEKERNVGHLKNEVERLENTVERMKTDLQKEVKENSQKDQLIKL